MTAIDRAELESAIQRHGGGIDPESFVAVLHDLVATADSLTVEEAAILSRHSGLSPTDTESEAQLKLLLSSVAGDREAEQRSWTTNEAAEILHTAPANVRRMVMRRELLTAGKRGATHLIPQWQLVNGRPLPHLAEVLKILPTTMHPLDIETLMTSAVEELGERTPAEWLVSGGAAERVLWLAESWTRG